MELVGGRSEHTTSPTRRRVVPFADVTNSTAFSFSNGQKKLGAAGDPRTGKSHKTKRVDFTLSVASNSDDSVKPATELPKSGQVPSLPPQSAKKRNNKGKDPADEESFSKPDPDTQILKYQHVAAPSRAEHRISKGKEPEEFQHTPPEFLQTAKNRNKKIKPSADEENSISTSSLSGKAKESQLEVVQHGSRMRNRNKKALSDAKRVAFLGQSSCPPVNRPKCIWNKVDRNEEGIHQNDDHPLQYSKTELERKRRRYSAPVTNIVAPLDSVERQRAYYAEIDAFELPVEFVSNESD